MALASMVAATSTAIAVKAAARTTQAGGNFLLSPARNHSRRATNLVKYMKKLILTKTSGSIQFAHLYEHIFCMEIEQLFARNHLYAYLDYSLDGATYYGGAVVISIDFYTDKAMAMLRKIRELKVNFNEATILIAVMQIIAEKEVRFKVAELPKLKSALKSLDEQAWHDIDDVAVIDTKDIKKRPSVFTIIKGTHAPAKELKVSITLSLDKSVSRELLPLSRQLAWMIIANLQNTLADKYGLFSEKDYYRDNTLTNVFHVAHGRNVDLSYIAQTSQDKITEMQRAKAFHQLLLDLRDTDYYNHSNIAPHPQDTYVDTGIFIGRQGWKRLATDDNYRLLIRNMSLKIIFGRQSINRMLAP